MIVYSQILFRWATSRPGSILYPYPGKFTFFNCLHYRTFFRTCQVG
nr:MAG TPA: hypothetical protein [Caudoviricetes sp.]